MSAAGLGTRFLETTRGQIVVLLRRAARTIEELAQALGLTDNAVRNHISTLERDGLVRQDGVRRGPGAGKPATIYALREEAEPLLSRAYPPVLTAVLDVIVDALPPEQAGALLVEVGRRLAASVGGTAAGPLDERVRAAAAVLNALGGDAEVVADGQGYRVRGWGCPLSASVARRPELCAAVEALVAEVAGAPARQRCEHGPRPRCCFEVPPAPAAPARPDAA